jgi:hypothetical protein
LGLLGGLLHGRAAPDPRVLNGTGLQEEIFNQKLLALCAAGKARLKQIKRFDMPGFVPPNEWVREMQRYGLLPPDLQPAERIDVYATEQDYWRLLWHTPSL